MAGAAYQIADEPRPGTLAQFAVNPFWPLFGFMLGGAWLGLSWFAFNGIAVGSPTIRRELALVVVGFVGSVAAVLGVEQVMFAFNLPPDAVRYGVLVVLVWKLLVAYWLYALQSRTMGVYEYYGGQLRNGLVVVILGMLARGYVLSWADSFHWVLAAVLA